MGWTPEYTADGHLIGRDGWLCPATAQELLERYRGKVRMFARNEARSQDDVRDVESAFWLDMFSPPSERSRHPEARDGAHSLARKFAAGTEPPSEHYYLACLRTIIRTIAMTESGIESSDALYQRGWVVSLSDDPSPDGSSESEEVSSNDALLKWRCTQRDGMRNDVDRVMYLREFLGYLEHHAPDLVPFVLAIENAPGGRYPAVLVGSVLGYDIKKSKECARRVMALADKFQRKPISGKADFHQITSSVGRAVPLHRSGLKQDTISRMKAAVPVLQQIEPQLAAFAQLILDGAHPADAGQTMGWDHLHACWHFNAIHTYLYRFRQGNYQHRPYPPDPPANWKSNLKLKPRGKYKTRKQQETSQPKPKQPISPEEMSRRISEGLRRRREERQNKTATPNAEDGRVELCA